MPVRGARRADRAVHRARPRGGDHRLPARLPGPAHRRLLHGDTGGARPRAAAAATGRLPHRQLQGQAHQREGPGQARSHPAGPAGPAGGRRAAHRGRRRRAAHHRRRRHQHHRRRPRRVPAGQRLRTDRRRAAQDGGQRHRAGEALAGRLDGRRTGRAVRPEHPGRAQRQLPDADRARDHGPQLRVAHRGDGGRLRPLVEDPALAPGVRPEQGGLVDARHLPARVEPGPGVGDRAAHRGDGHRRERQHVHLRGRRPGEHPRRHARRPGTRSPSTRSVT